MTTAPVFLKRLGKPPSAADLRRRNWLIVHEDQLSDGIGPLKSEPAESLGIVLIESRHKASLRPYHRQRLAIQWANQRHFALEQRQRGVAVHYVFGERPLREEIPAALAKLGVERARMLTPAERETRADLMPLIRDKTLELVRHDGWLTTHEDFQASHSGPPWRMDSFYRFVRRKTGILMEGPGKDKFLGGKVSFDTENRKPYAGPPGDPPPATPPTFSPDEITAEVLAMVARDFAHHPGTLDEKSVPATLADAEALWAWALKRCLPHFGPYEDAMTVRSTTLFHTRVSTLMNLHRLLPARIVADAEKADIPLASKEGFIRQILGWREFVRHVHIATDGFRKLPGGKHASADPPCGPVPGDGGYARWAGKPWPLPAGIKAGDAPDTGGAAPHYLACEQSPSAPLPPAFWGAPSGLKCLDTVVASVWAEGWSHHITRLMVLSNIATLLDISPRELTDWFWVAYTDAWDWVVEPNVLGMGTYALGEVMTTKPYIAGSAYIDKMSDYCDSCAFVPGKTCPIGPMYWGMLDRHREQLKDNARLFMPMRSLAKRTDAQRAADAAVTAVVREVLINGQKLTPATLAQRTAASGGEKAPSKATGKGRGKPA